MQAEILTATMAAMEGFLALRASGGNPNHVASGEKGGQFTSGSGGGGPATKPHGKHWARRQRRKKKLLAKLKAEGHAKIAKVKEKQRAERKALREKHRSTGTNYKARRSETKALASKQRAERQSVVTELKAEVRKSVESLKVAKPVGQSQSEKLKEFQAKKEKVNKLFGELGGEELKKNMVRHTAERKAIVSDLKTERTEMRQTFTEERTKALTEIKENYKHDRDWAANNAKPDGPHAVREAIQQARGFAIEEGKVVLSTLRQTQRDQLEDHREHVKTVMEKMDAAHYRENLVVTKVNAKGRRAILDKLKKQLEERSLGITSTGRTLAGWETQERAVTAQSRMHRSRIAKASSAESILKHCLRGRTGWLKRWREGRLTGQQHLTLLEDVRQYGRAWLRHEMGGFFEHYGASNEQARGIWGDDRFSDGHETTGGNEFVRSPGNVGGESSRDVWDSSIVSRGLADRLLSPLRRTFDRMRQFTRELIHAAGMAVAGPDLSMEDYAFLDQQADKQDDYLETFRREMEANPPREIATPEPVGMPSQVVMVQQPRSPAQITARAELYGNAAWQAGQKLNRRRVFKMPLNVLLEPEDDDKIDLVAEPPGTELPYPIAGPPRRPPRKIPTWAKYERRILGHPKTEHCTDCPPLAAMGWQPVGALPDIGESECGGLCLCHFEYADSPTGNGATKVPGKPSAEPRRRKDGEQPVLVAPIKANPTNEEIDAEFKKWIAGQPSKIAVKDKPPRWDTEQEEKDFVLPPGYEWSS